VSPSSDSNRSTSRRVLVGLVGALLFGGTAIVALHDWAQIGGPGLSSFVNGPVYDAVVFAASFACLLKALDSGRERTAWLLIAAGLLCWAAAEVYWTAVIETEASPPYPSLADAGYLAMYPLTAAGLLSLVRCRAHEIDWRLWMDALVAALGTAALGAALIFQFVANHAEGSGLEKATTLAYPLGDITMLGLVVGVVALTRWRPGPTWILLLAAMATTAVADVAFTLQTTESILPAGPWTDPIYLIAACCYGAVLWQPRATEIAPAPPADGWRELMTPGIFAMLMVAFFSLRYFDGASGLTMALWAATMMVVLARLGLSTRENRRLLEQAQTDRLTGLGNQALLESDVDQACAGTEHTTLVLLDLNRFKRYNDTFGHLAGNQLLAGFGAALRAAMPQGGEAYRAGGDEFAALLPGPRSDHSETIAGISAALSATGFGFDVSAAWGAVAIPDEAHDRATAIQLADARMYAHKESGEVAGTVAPAADAVRNRLRAGAIDGETLEQRN